MIFRKPYAFLIKHFRLIHLILTIILGYILYRTNRVLSFFNEYLDMRTYERMENLKKIYIPNYLYLIILSSILISIIIFWLMKAKEKPLKYYIFQILYYVVLIVGFMYIGNQLQNIAFNQIDVLQLKITRDILYILFLVQIPFFVIALVRATGFNIKKFNFQRDLMELNVTSSDNEEVELDVDIDSNDVKTSFRRRGRIALYVFKENTALILAAAGIIFIITGSLLYNIKFVKNKIYTENEPFTYNGIQIKVLSSYQFNTNLFGTDISSNRYSYTIARINVKNTSKEEKTIYAESFRLRIGTRISYTPTLKYNNQFEALGNSLSKLTLQPKEESIMVVIFQIDKQYEDHKKQLEYIKSYKEVEGVRTYNLIKISLNAQKIPNSTLIKSAKINETLDFNGSILNNTNITINKFDLSDNFMYQYQQCLDTCYNLTDYITPKFYSTQNMMVMRLKVDINIDEKIYNNDLDQELITSIGHIRYIIDDKEYKQEVPIVNITPNHVSDYVYYEVKGELKRATSVYLDFTILDKTYTYILKN